MVLALVWASAFGGWGDPAARTEATDACSVPLQPICAPPSHKSTTQSPTIRWGRNAKRQTQRLRIDPLATVLASAHSRVISTWLVLTTRHGAVQSYLIFHHRMLVVDLVGHAIRYTRPEWMCSTRSTHVDKLGAQRAVFQGLPSQEEGED